MTRTIESEKDGAEGGDAGATSSLAQALRTLAEQLGKRIPFGSRDARATRGQTSWRQGSVLEGERNDPGEECVNA